MNTRYHLGCDQDDCRDPHCNHCYDLERKRETPSSCSEMTCRDSYGLMTLRRSCRDPLLHSKVVCHCGMILGESIDPGKYLRLGHPQVLAVRSPVQGVSKFGMDQQIEKSIFPPSLFCAGILFSVVLLQHHTLKDDSQARLSAFQCSIGLVALLPNVKQRVQT